ncbi:hypothetical protein KIN20_020439 [Parelaphostrongylus tenuis]|uniref:Uncharacterized protein n=1 Tax=Parelaphostrongylus tenuis TaxID=148309 RepID=A0AAD5N449_PARTN|nr:hypothetical protein KIN20_020439 [Parelaphostrongylus tenuis]
MDESDLQAASDAEPSSIVRNLAEEFGVLKRTILKKFHEFDIVHKKPRRDLYEPSQLRLL